MILELDRSHYFLLNLCHRRTSALSKWRSGSTSDRLTCWTLAFWTGRLKGFRFLSQEVPRVSELKEYEKPVRESLFLIQNCPFLRASPGYVRSKEGYTMLEVKLNTWVLGSPIQDILRRVWLKTNEKSTVLTSEVPCAVGGTLAIVTVFVASGQEVPPCMDNSTGEFAPCQIVPAARCSNVDLPSSLA